MPDKEQLRDFLRMATITTLGLAVLAASIFVAVAPFVFTDAMSSLLTGIDGHADRPVQFDAFVSEHDLLSLMWVIFWGLGPLAFYFGLCVPPMWRTLFRKVPLPDPEVEKEKAEAAAKERTEAARRTQYKQTEAFRVPEDVLRMYRRAYGLEAEEEDDPVETSRDPIPVKVVQVRREPYQLPQPEQPQAQAQQQPRRVTTGFSRKTQRPFFIKRRQVINTTGE